LPVVARAFAELGYRRTTTAELARRCRVRENILYRLWRDKKAMFVASIEFVYDASETIWRGLLAERDDAAPAAQRLLRFEADHYGESGLYRLIFAGLSETDDSEIRKALARMYGRFHRFIDRQIEVYRGGKGAPRGPDSVLSAWGVIGLGTVANIVQELGLLSAARRRHFIAEVGSLLVAGTMEG